MKLKIWHTFVVYVYLRKWFSFLTAHELLIENNCCTFVWFFPKLLLFKLEYPWIKQLLPDFTPHSSYIVVYNSDVWFSNLFWKESNWLDTIRRVGCIWPKRPLIIINRADGGFWTNSCLVVCQLTHSTQPANLI